MNATTNDIEDPSPASSFVQVPGTTFEQGFVAPSTTPQPSMAKRICIGAIGILLGMFTFLPNAMMAASSAFAGNMGIIASLSFIGGGVYGGWKGEFMYLIPGFCLQLLTLVYVVATNSM